LTTLVDRFPVKLKAMIVFLDDFTFSIF